MNHYSTPKKAIETLKGYEPDEPIIWDAVYFGDFADDELTREDWLEVCNRINNTCDILLDEHLIRDVINEILYERENRNGDN